MTAYAYDANGNRESLTFLGANGPVTAYTYNDANLVARAENKRGGTLLSSYTYTYALDGNQLTKTDHTGKVAAYAYDSMGRLIREAVSGGNTATYSYDRYGNRSKKTMTGTQSYTVDYTYDLNNRLLKEVKTQDGTTETTVYQYDSNGNMLHKQTDSNVATAEVREYNGFNQLVWAYIDRVVAEYAYRPDNLRYSKTVGGEKTIHWWNNGKISADYSPADNKITNSTKSADAFWQQNGCT